MDVVSPAELRWISRMSLAEGCLSSNDDRLHSSSKRSRRLLVTTLEEVFAYYPDRRSLLGATPDFEAWVEMPPAARWTPTYGVPPFY
jgi:hypothetical protein